MMKRSSQKHKVLLCSIIQLPRYHSSFPTGVWLASAAAATATAITADATFIPGHNGTMKKLHISISLQLKTFKVQKFPNE